jgi:hypothetical protein
MMTTTEIVEVALAAAMNVAGIVIYRRGGNQGAVLLFVIAVILLIHGLGFMEYRPSASELGQ